MDPEVDFNTMDFKTIMEAKVAQDIDEITNLKLVFDDLTVNTIVLIDIFGGARLKTHILTFMR